MATYYIKFRLGDRLSNSLLPEECQALVDCASKLFNIVSLEQCGYGQ